MEARLRSWMIIGIIILLAFIGFSIAAYRSQWKWAGFSDKTVWDWLTLLFVPIAVALGVYLLDQRQRERERRLEQQREQEREEDKQHEAILKAYLDKMSELMLNYRLDDSERSIQARKIARVQTLTVVSQLDGKRKGSVVQFLYEGGLIQNEVTTIALDGADLSRAIMSGFQLSKANLSKTDLSGASFVLANLSGTNLADTQLEEANLSLASLDGADLSGANLSGANLSGTYVSEEQVKIAKSLKGATMPDGSIHR